MILLNSGRGCLQKTFLFNRKLFYVHPKLFFTASKAKVRACHPDGTDFLINKKSIAMNKKEKRKFLTVSYSGCFSFY